MAKKMLACVALLALLGCVGHSVVKIDNTPGQVNTPTKSRLWTSCVQVVARGADGLRKGRGSGTVIAPNRILTAWHVVDDAVTITVERVKRDDMWAATAKVVAFSLELDLCLMEADTAGLTPMPFVDGATYRWQECIAVGYAYGFPDPTYTTGHLQALDERDLRYSALGWFGSSGGGVFVVEQGEYVLCSVTQRVVLDKGQVVNYMMLGCAPERIREFLKGAE